MFRQTRTKINAQPLTSKAPTPAVDVAEAIPKLPSPLPESQPDQPEALGPPLLGAFICSTGITINERENIRILVEEMGGKVSGDLAMETTHLIAKNKSSEKYKAAHKLGIPVISEKWVYDIHKVWKEGKPLNVNKSIENYVVGPLNGCRICVTGIPLERRWLVERDTIRYGGVYTNDLYKDSTTHLICGTASGIKYTSAMRWGIKCVPRRWLLDSIDALEIADEKKYSPLDPDPADQEGDEALQIVPKSMYLEMCQIYLCSSFSETLNSRLKKLIRMAGGIHIAEYDPNNVTHVLVPSDQLDPATMALFSKDDTGIPYIVHQQWLKDSNRQDKILPEAYYTVSLPTRTEDGQLNPAQIEHYSAWTKDRLIRNTETNREVRKTGANPMAYRTKSETSPETTPTKRVRSTSPSKLSPQQYRNGLRARTISGILSDTLDDLSINKTMGSFPLTPGTSGASKPEPTEDDDAQASNIFLGLYITSHGCKGAQMIKEQTIACGGTYFDESETPPADAPIKTIVPLSMPYEKTKNLPGVVMTICWLEKSLEVEKVIPRNDFFLYKPMKNIPVQGFDKLRISVSSTHMQRTEYKQIERAIKILGGTFLDKLHSKNTDVLICDIPEGPKYEFMTLAQRPIVKMEWLINCIEEGKTLPFKGFLLNDDLKLKVKKETGNSLSRTSSSTSLSANTSLRSNSSMTITSMVSTQQLAPSETPLEGLVVCLLSRVTGDHIEMQDLITGMGARLITSYDSSATHFIHRGKATVEAKRDLKAAKRDGIYIVSPEWLYKCRETGMRANERDYPEVFDGKHMTLNTTTTILRSPQERPPLAVLQMQSSSPSSRGSNNSGSSNSRRKGSGRSASVGFQSRSGSVHTSPSQAFQGTAAGAMSAMFNGESVSCSLNMSSVDNSMDVSSMGDMLSMEQISGSISETLGIWQPVQPLPVTRNGASRKRRKATLGTEETGRSSVDLDSSATIKTSDTTNDGTNIPEDYFDKSAERYGEDAVYWEDVEGREKKRALLESLGYKTFKPPTPQIDGRAEALSRELESQRNCRYYFLLTGINLADRGSFKKIINQLGGVVLDDITENGDEWREKCTHLITNGHKPPKTAKLVLAKQCRAIIVTKAYITASGEEGAFVDETPFRVNI